MWLHILVSYHSIVITCAYCTFLHFWHSLVPLTLQLEPFKVPAHGWFMLRDIIYLTRLLLVNLNELLIYVK
jgi:hypothetical protein